MRKSKLALLVVVLLSPLTAVGCTGDKAESAPSPISEMKAYTLSEALAICETLPEDDAAACVTAAHSVEWGQ